MLLVALALFSPGGETLGALLGRASAEKPRAGAELRALKDMLPASRGVETGRQPRGRYRRPWHCQVAGMTSAKCQRLMDGQAAATAFRHVVIATPRSARCVWADVALRLNVRLRPFDAPEWSYITD